VEKGNLNKAFVILNKYSAIIALAIVVLYGAIFVPNFLREANLTAIMYQYSIIGFLALGQMLVILTGGIDLSQGSFVALTSVVAATLMVQAGAIPAALGALIFCGGLGLISGIIVAKTKIPAFVATLGMLGIGRGLAKFIANAKPIPIKDDMFKSLGRAELFGIPICFLLWILICVLLFYFLKKRKLGRYIYAVGSSEESARLAGINIARTKMFVYMMAGLFTAFGGLIWAARLGSASPIGGMNYEMESIAAVVVGGGSLNGGVGSVLGTAAGVLLFGVINSILNLSGISPFWQGAIKGTIILLAVAISQLQRRRNSK
jgi:ribose/xylose/arabinose/galactoside ABC-type transport system permease subunit